MPHVIVKRWLGIGNAQKTRLTDAIVRRDVTNVLP
jgi:hypothetical protein